MSFVSENNSPSGYKTCIEALKHPMCILAWEESQMAETLLHTRRACGCRAPKREAPPSWDPGQLAFLITILFPVFSRSDVGALWWGFFSPLPQHVGLKRFREFRNSSVLWFHFLCGGFHSFALPREKWPYHTAQVWERLPTVPSGRLRGGVFPSVTVKGRVIQYLWISRNVAFLWCLSNGSSHFY